MTPLHQSTAKDLIKSPALARWKLDNDSGDTPAMAHGRLFEALICGADLGGFAVIDAADYRTKAAQEARDEAIRNGLTPILRPKLQDAKIGAQAIRDQFNFILDRHNLPPISEWWQQAYLEWTHGCPCAGTLDLVIPGFIADLKSCADISPRGFTSAATRFWYDVQAAAYLEACQSLSGQWGEWEFLFLCYSVDPIPQVAVYQLGEEWLTVGRDKWNHAKQVWMRCNETNVWPGMNNGNIQTLNMPGYAAYWEDEIDATV